MSFFEKLRDGTGSRLLQKYGDVFRITKETPAVYNPTTGSVTSSAVTQDVFGKAFSRGERFDGGEMVQTDEDEIFLTASEIIFPPEAGMSIKTPTNSTTPQRIINVQAIPASGVVVLYRVIARR